MPIIRSSANSKLGWMAFGILLLLVLGKWAIDARGTDQGYRAADTAAAGTSPDYPSRTEAQSNRAALDAIDAANAAEATASDGYSSSAAARSEQYTASDRDFLASHGVSESEARAVEQAICRDPSYRSAYPEDC